MVTSDLDNSKFYLEVINGSLFRDKNKEIELIGFVKKKGSFWIYVMVLERWKMS